MTPTLNIAALPWERHEIGLMMLAALLRSDGCFLGATRPSTMHSGWR
jgi:hypothetical protein